MARGDEAPAHFSPASTGQECLISLFDIRKSFAALEVLHGVSLQIRESEALALIGSSGSGKSTMLRCINLLERPTSGQVWYRGKDLTAGEPNLREVRRQIGMVFQSFNLYPHMTALGNVTLALRKSLGMRRREAEEVAFDALRTVGLAEKSRSYPSQLSGGQQQRVGIARALALKPEVVLFDEPTSALDPELVGEVLDVMSRLREQGMTMVIVTHELSFARRIADRVAFMDRGSLVEEAPPEELFTNPRHERTRAFIGSHVR